MEQPLSRLAYLFSRYAQDACTEAERSEFLYLVQQAENAAELNRLIGHDVENGITDREIEVHRADQIYNAVVQAIVEPKDKLGVIKKMFPWKRIVAASAIIILLGVGTYFVFFNNATKEARVVETKPGSTQDIVPGKYKARLTLADGSVVVIDSAASGKLARQGSTEISNKEGQVIYEIQGRSRDVIYNTLSTARGETYATVLADGSKIWLNAASSIKFPVVFNGHERRVEITGEAYFEVTHNANMPFVVMVNGIEVQDLGTRFNINAYQDEPNTKTTLVEGMVRIVTRPSAIGYMQTAVLRPGEQAIISADSSLTIDRSPDIQQAIAWRNGKFNFGDKTDLQSIMRQIAKWYDVEVIFENGGQLRPQFGGEMPRNTNLLQVLEMLEISGVRYKVEGRKILIKQ